MINIFLSIYLHKINYSLQSRPIIEKLIVHSAANINYDVTQFHVYWLINISKAAGEIN